jgi:hypothetical protein
MKSSKTLPLHTSNSDSNLSDAGTEDLTVTDDVSDTSSQQSHDDIILDDRRTSSVVSFGPIQIREYERIVGDHPDTKIGVPISIGWAYYERKPVPIDKYEKQRMERGPKNLRMTSITRKNLLHNVFGIPEEELREAEMEVQKIKKQRVQSSQQSGVSAKAESTMKGIGRMVRRGGWTLLKGMAAAAQSGLMVSPTGGAMSAY